MREKKKQRETESKSVIITVVYIQTLDLVGGSGTHHFLSLLIKFRRVIGLDQTFPGVLAAFSCGANANAAGTYLQRGTSAGVQTNSNQLLENC